MERLEETDIFPKLKKNPPEEMPSDGTFFLPSLLEGFLRSAAEA